MPLSKPPTVTTTPPPVRHERRKDARPGELLAAALALFVEKGYAATRAEEVAHRAGVSKGTLFLYFSSKEELFKAVVRENISGGFSQWNAEFDAFDGNTPDMLRHCMTLWWQRQGNARVSGITKLMLSEGKNFPELALFYQQEVIEPAHLLIARILQRGVDRGEFAPLDMKYAVFAVLAPMIFLQLLMHSNTAYYGSTAHTEVVPEDYLASQLQIILAGLCLRPAAAVTNKGNHRL